MLSRYKISLSAAVAVAVFAVSACGEVVSREDFVSRVKDGSEAHVVKQVGKASRIEEMPPDRVRWVYTSKTFNLEKGNAFDRQTVVIFTRAPDGSLRVTDVQFEQ